MPRSRKLSKQARRAILCLYAAAPKGRYGYEILKETGLKSGSLYPILMRLAGAGFLESAWVPSELAGRPARRVYRLTAEGIALAGGLETPAADPRLRAGESLA